MTPKQTIKALGIELDGADRRIKELVGEVDKWYNLYDSLLVLFQKRCQHHYFVDLDDHPIGRGYVCPHCGLSKYPEALLSIVTKYRLVADDGGWDLEYFDTRHCGLPRKNNYPLDLYLPEQPNLNSLYKDRVIEVKSIWSKIWNSF